MIEVALLARTYPCRLGAPLLHGVERRIFSLSYFRDCMACGFCHDACCDHGVDVDADNAARLRSLPAGFKARIATPERAWFTPAAADPEFPSGAFVRTRTANGACVFRAARGCAIHAWCLEQGLDYHDYKPLVSTLFPVTFEQGVLAASGEAADGSLICGGAGPSLYDGARDELLYYFGSGLVAELDALSRRS